MSREQKIEGIIKQGEFKSTNVKIEPVASFYEMETPEGVLIPMVQIAGPHKPFMLSKAKAHSVFELAEYLKKWMNS